MTIVPESVDLSGFSSSGIRLVTEAFGIADRDHNAEVTPITFLIAFLEQDTPLAEGFRRAVGDADGLLSAAKSLSAEAPEGTTSPALGASMREILTNRASAFARNDAHRSEIPWIPIGEIQIIESILEAPEIHSFLSEQRLNVLTLHEKMFDEFKLLVSQQPKPVIREERQLVRGKDEAWAIEYWIERPDQTRFRVVVHCSKKAESLVTASTNREMRCAFDTRCRSKALTLGYIPSVQEARIWIDEETGTVRTRITAGSLDG